MFSKKAFLTAFLFILFISLYLYYSGLAPILPYKKEQTPKDTHISKEVKENKPKNSSNTEKPKDICKAYRDTYFTELVKKREKPENPQKIIGYQNNKFGLYIYRVDDFARKAAEMVNSNGGDWGYVLVPYNVKDYDVKKWNSFFKVLNEYHLIPIIQLWDVSEDRDKARKETEKSAEFLNSLNWPIKNRYISVYNEANDSKFWKGGANPKEYAWILNKTIKIYKEVNPDFFILNGAFNASARGGNGYIDEEQFLIEMDKAEPGVLKKLDGWASHPYPHIRGYLGDPYDTGRASIRGYEWELSLLKKYFQIDNIPVFITETGWPHAEGKKYRNDYYPEEKVAEYYKIAFEKVWLPDERVVAVTPFTIKYDPPFDNFSFIKRDGGVYKQFNVLKSMPKIAGRPPLVEKYDPLKEKCLRIIEQETKSK